MCGGTGNGVPSCARGAPPMAACWRCCAVSLPCCTKLVRCTPCSQVVVIFGHSSLPCRLQEVAEQIMPPSSLSPLNPVRCACLQTSSTVYPWKCKAREERSLELLRSLMMSVVEPALQCDAMCVPLQRVHDIQQEGREASTRRKKRTCMYFFSLTHEIADNSCTTNIHA